MMPVRLRTGMGFSAYDPRGDRGDENNEQHDAEIGNEERHLAFGDLADAQTGDVGHAEQVDRDRRRAAAERVEDAEHDAEVDHVDAELLGNRPEQRHE